MDDTTAEVPQEATQATPTPATPLSSAPATTASSAAGDASDARHAALDGDLDYTLTIDQARAIFDARHRKVPAERTLQNYCIHKIVAAKKVSTSSGQEWLLNEQSLDTYIEDQPMVTTAQATHTVALPRNDAPATTASSDAGDASIAEPDSARRRSFDDTDIYEHPYVKKLEHQIEKWEDKYDKQVRRTEDLQLKAQENLVELQRMTAVGQSEGLAKFMLQAKNWFTSGEPASDTERPSNGTTDPLSANYKRDGEQH